MHTIPSVNTDHIRRKWLNLPYAAQSKAQQLDIYLPEVGEGPFPIILAVHGGAFKMGDKADFQLKPMLEGLKRQYAIVSINYRLSGEAIFPAQIYDVKAAIRWIKANASEYHLDASRIAAWGGSAGGNLVSLIGTSSHVQELEDLSMGNADFSCEVQVVVDWFGPTNFLTMDDLFVHSEVEGKQKHNAPDSPESQLLGQTITDVPEKVMMANPETYISSQTPPFFIQHGTRDPLIPTQQSVIFAEKLVDVLGSDTVKLELLEGAGHGGPEFETVENVSKVLDFIDHYLK